MSKKGSKKDPQKQAQKAGICPGPQKGQKIEQTL